MGIELFLVMTFFPVELRVFDSAQSACAYHSAYEVKGEGPLRGKAVWQLTIKAPPNCTSTRFSDRQFIDCLATGGEMSVIKEGRCEPKKEFYFAEEKGAKK